MDVTILYRISSTEPEAAQTKTQVRIFWAYVFNDRKYIRSSWQTAGHPVAPCADARVLKHAYCRHMTVADSYLDTTCRLWCLFDMAKDEVYAPSFKELSQVARSHVTCSLRGQLQDLYSGTDGCMKIRRSTSERVARSIPPEYRVSHCNHISQQTSSGARNTRRPPKNTANDGEVCKCNLSSSPRALQGSFFRRRPVVPCPPYHPRLRCLPPDRNVFGAQHSA